MSTLTCAQVRELAPELALGILGGAERAEVVLHLETCARCQAHVAELTEAADMLPQLAPEAEPPTGFETRTMRRLDEGRRRSRRRLVATIAAVAAAVAILSVTVVRVVESQQDPQVAAPGGSTTQRGDAIVPVLMRGGVSQATAGWAYVAGRHGVAVAVDYGVPTGAYTVSVAPENGPTATIGTMRVTDGRGSWTGRSRIALGGGSRIVLLDAAGGEVCHGTVPTAG
jgi:predicted anti-sigma-YlaC factor YlaD